MSNKSLFFEEFQPVNKKDWLEKVMVDLKGKALSSLDNEVEEGLTLSPFFHKDDMQAYPSGGLINFRRAEWRIGAIYELGSASAVNKAMREELAGGVNAPLLNILKEMDKQSITTLFQDVNPLWIYNQFEGVSSEVLISFWNNWMGYLQQKGVNLKEVGGNLGLPVTGSLPDIHRQSADFARKNMPDFSIFQVKEKVNSSYSESLASLLSEANHLLEQDSNFATQLQFKVTVDGNYFASISKLRALHILWSNLLKAYDLPIDLPLKISVHFSAQAQFEDSYQNMISAASMALSGIIGGGTTVYIPSSKPSGDSVSRRIARNVNHLLKMESYINKVVDPAAGSYYVESLTRELAERAWVYFRN